VIHSAFANQPGAPLDMLLLNAGAAIYVADLADSIEEGIAKARAVITSGQAQEKMDQLLALSKDISQA
jgi:anthranilate phosphoribosyltransferase